MKGHDHTVDSKILNFLKQKYNIISIIEFTDFDCDYDILEQWLEYNSKLTFRHNDRFVITHFDTDYYIENRYGITLNNFFRLWKKYNIPMYTMFFYTNHQGISAEIDNILKYNDINDRPTVFETIINRLNYPIDGHKENDTNVNSINYHGLFLAAGNQRSHRQALYNKIKHLYPNKIAASIKRNTQ